MTTPSSVATCTGCCRSYDARSFIAECRGIGEQDTGVPGYHLELRNCACGSTIAAAVAETGAMLTEVEWETVEAVYDGTAKAARRAKGGAA